MSSYRSSQPLDLKLAELIEAEPDYHGAHCSALRELSKLVMEERLANAAKLAAAVLERAPALSEGAYLRVKHLLYLLIREGMPTNKVREYVEDACRTVEAGGVQMARPEAMLATELAQCINGGDEILRALDADDRERGG